LAAAGGSAAATRALEQAQDADYEAQNLEIHQVRIMRIFCFEFYSCCRLSFVLWFQVVVFGLSATTLLTLPTSSFIFRMLTGREWNRVCQRPGLGARLLGR
jgi:hypothetical protein